MLTYINDYFLKRKLLRKVKEEYPIFYEMWKDRVNIRVLREYTELSALGPTMGYTRELKRDYDTKALYTIYKRYLLFSWFPNGWKRYNIRPVSYTHLTLPTNREV